MPPPGRDYTKFLDRGGLRGARIGLPRAFFYDRVAPPGGSSARNLPAPGRGASSGRPERADGRGGLNDDQKKVMDEAIAALKKEGAVVVDPADIPSILDKEPRNNFMTWGICSGSENAKGKDADCSVVLKYGMKR